MTTKRWMIGTLAAAFTLVANSPARADDGDPAPVLVVEENEEETPEPVCEICVIVAKKSTDTSSSSASLTLTHTDTFEGDVEMVVWLESGQQTTLWIDDVTITNGLLDVEVQSGSDWSWSDVRFAWARYHSTL